jgi:putative ATPase
VVDSTGRSLGELRDRIFELAQVQRHHLLLDLNAGSGLLTWEALRRAPEGGVWALAAEPQAGEALRQQAASRLPELQRPSVLVGEPQELAYLLQLRGEDDVRFDRILSRNPLAHFELASATFAAAAALLRDDGRFVFVQVVPRHGQRLHELIDWSGTPELQKLVVQAEEAIYNDEGDPLVRWKAPDLQEALRAAGFARIDLKREQLTEQRRLTDRHLQRWFHEDPLEDGRLSYGRRLLQGGLSESQIDELTRLYTRQLRDETVAWRSTVVFVVAGTTD